MCRFTLPFIIFFFILSSCEPVTEKRYDESGNPLPVVNRIPPYTAAKLQFRMLDSINALRQASGLKNLSLDKNLNAAAATHSRDMSAQNRPWHFGSDGSSPFERVKRAQFTGTMLGEVISETYETDLQTLTVWIQDEGSRSVLLSPQATRMGFSWFQEPNGKIWWTLVTGKYETLMDE
ncbi:MAG: CAP domain-containing protein [Aestuariivita sp.]|nr:CAP domain-containing protein [Aestuariivita sp.]